MFVAGVDWMMHASSRPIAATVMLRTCPRAASENLSGHGNSRCLKETYTRILDLSVFLSPSWTNYHNVWFVHPFKQWMINSLIVATVATVLILFIDSLAGYALARWRR